MLRWVTTHVGVVPGCTEWLRAIGVLVNLMVSALSHGWCNGKHHLVLQHSNVKAHLRHTFTAEVPRSQILERMDGREDGHDVLDDKFVLVRWSLKDSEDGKAGSERVGWMVEAIVHCMKAAPCKFPLHKQNILCTNLWIKDRPWNHLVLDFKHTSSIDQSWSIMINPPSNITTYLPWKTMQHDTHLYIVTILPQMLSVPSWCSSASV